MAKRKQLGAKRRFDVFKRDGFTCQYCGAHPPGVVLHVDHIEPIAEGGSNDIDNLVTSCDGCNFGKGATLLTSAPQSLSDKAAEIAEREKQIRGYSQVMAERRRRVEDECWRIVEVIEGKRETNKDWFQSIKRFVETLGFEAVLEAAEIADARKHSTYGAFKYFCGICWNKIRESEH